MAGLTINPGAVTINSAHAINLARLALRFMNILPNFAFILPLRVQLLRRLMELAPTNPVTFHTSPLPPKTQEERSRCFRVQCG
jgi:hypothetical protein